MDVLSPELALVDPELAAAARRLLRGPGDCLAGRAREGPVAAQSPVPSGRRRPSALAVLATLVVAVIVGSPAVDLIPRSSAGPSFAEPSPTVVEPVREQRSADSQGIARATELRWPLVAGADFYDVVLWRDGKRVLDVWPRTNRLVVPAGGALEARTLAPGRYLWFVYAGFDGKTAPRFGALLAHGELDVTPGTAPPAG
jgi:hypothetical protein